MIKHFASLLLACHSFNLATTLSFWLNNMGGVWARNYSSQIWSKKMWNNLNIWTVFICFYSFLKCILCCVYFAAIIVTIISVHLFRYRSYSFVRSSIWGFFYFNIEKVNTFNGLLLRFQKFNLFCLLLPGK